MNYKILDSLMNYLDIYAIKNNLSYKRKENFVTFCGFSLSIIYFLFFIIISIYYIYHYFINKKYTFFVNSKYDPNLTINLTNKYFSFGIFAENINEIDLNEMFKINAYLKNDINFLELNIMKCNISMNFYNININNYDNVNYSNLYCINLLQNILLGKNNNEYLIVKIYKKKEYDKNLFIKKNIRPKFLMFSIDYLMNNDNYKNPIKKTIKKEVFNININYTNKLFYSLTKCFYNSGKIILHQNQNELSYFEYDKKQIIYDDESNELFNFILYPNYYIKENKRYYFNFEFLLCEIKVIIELLNFFLSLLSSYFIKKIYIINRINSLMFSNKTYLDHNDENKFTTLKNLLTLSNNNSINNANFQNENLTMSGHNLFIKLKEKSKYKTSLFKNETSLNFNKLLKRTGTDNFRLKKWQQLNKSIFYRLSYFFIPLFFMKKNFKNYNEEIKLFNQNITDELSIENFYSLIIKGNLLHELHNKNTINSKIKNLSFINKNSIRISKIFPKNFN